jgi:collagen type III alpha
MRLGFNGFGTPIPDEAMPSATLGDLPTQTLVLTEEGFRAEDYVGLGYTHYEVMCVGGAGGNGGNRKSGFGAWSNGGGGGGGGLHIVTGLLVALPALVEVVIGAAGADGADEPNVGKADPSWHAPLDGEDGGASTFNGETCKASGGKGGEGTKQGIDVVWLGVGPASSTFYRPGGRGGAGGIGGQVEAGGGAAGAGTIFTDPGPGPHAREDGPQYWSRPQGSDGSWDGTIGQGGGGGDGGTYFGSDSGPDVGVF